MISIDRSRSLAAACLVGGILHGPAGKGHNIFRAKIFFSWLWGDGGSQSGESGLMAKAINEEKRLFFFSALHKLIPPLPLPPIPHLSLKINWFQLFLHSLKSN